MNCPCPCINCSTGNCWMCHTIDEDPTQAPIGWIVTS